MSPVEISKQFKSFLSGQDPANPWIQKAIQDVINSGLTEQILEVAEVRVFNGSLEELAKLLNLDASKMFLVENCSAAILFPYFNLQNGSVLFCRIKRFPHLEGSDGHKIKYLQPTGTPVVPYILSQVWEKRKDLQIPLWIVEGEKKALKLIQHGCSAIGLAGVWNFKPKGSEGVNPQDQDLFPELNEFSWEGRKVFLAFDADLFTNRNVRLALYQLGFRLIGKNADVRIALWKGSMGKGVDDYLAGIKDPEKELIEIQNNAPELISFIKPEHSEEVISALHKSGLSKIKVEQLAKRLAEPLETSAKTITGEITRLGKRYSQSIMVPGSPYDVSEGKLMLLGGGSPTPIADFTAIISKVWVLEDGRDLYQIDGVTVRGFRFSLQILSEEFSDSKQLKTALEEAAGPSAPVYPNGIPHLGPAIKKISNPEQIGKGRQFNRIGWFDDIDGKRILIKGREPDGVEIQPHVNKHPYRIDPDANLVIGLQALDDLILSVEPGKATVLLSALFQAPLARLVGWDNERYVVMIKGRTGSFKTSFTMAALCIYGPEFINSTNLIKWGEGATNNSIMKMATVSCDFPILIDNYKPNTGQGSKAFVGIIHNIVEGGEKDRMQKNLEMKPTLPIYSWPVCTGEDIPDDDPASLARILVIVFEVPAIKTNSHLTQAQNQSEHLCAVGGVWLNYLEVLANEGASLKKAFQDVFDTRRTEWIGRLEVMNPKMANIHRMASNLATNEITWGVVSKVPELKAVLGKYADAYKTGIQNVARQMASSLSESLEAEKFITVIRELLNSGRYQLAPEGKPIEPANPDRCLGWRNADGSVYLQPIIARNAVEHLKGTKIPISDQTLYVQLDQLHYLASKGTNQTTLVAKISGKSVRVLHIAPSVLVDPDPPKDDKISKAENDEVPF